MIITTSGHFTKGAALWRLKVKAAQKGLTILEYRISWDILDFYSAQAICEEE